ncbi:hypothetical protein DFH06DRAFT_1303290 [Mycena polygramma]|nr:hypothetical protein DFH06DRAFT_1303290 [Mycena polygramma]
MPDCVNSIKRRGSIRTAKTLPGICHLGLPLYQPSADMDTPFAHIDGSDDSSEADDSKYPIDVADEEAAEGESDASGMGLSCVLGRMFGDRRGVHGFSAFSGEWGDVRVGSRDRKPKHSQIRHVPPRIAVTRDETVGDWKQIWHYFEWQI